ncbi:hypothetical protein [Gemmobacter denitrificans]|uniref:Uncharacterized protein n=1 Tax=Gemmobacter denitrificans TaxID=3123040 RepID=A0ABU8BX14_9RHOB
MTKRRGPVFLARRSYRLRRMRDAARLLPIAGAFLFLLPILWEPDRSASRDTATDGIYLFVIWALLVLIAALMAPGLGTGEEPESGAHGDEEAPH